MTKIPEFCCKKISELIANNINNEGSLFTPFYLVKPDVYDFCNRDVFFCPSCGINFISKTNHPKPAKNKDLCCETMEDLINVQDPKNEFMICYQPFARRHFFTTNLDFLGQTGGLFPEWEFNFCIYCGKQLPDSLFLRWLDIVQRELKISIEGGPMSRILSLVPEEFKTEAWWKNRNIPPNSGRPRIYSFLSN